MILPASGSILIAAAIALAGFGPEPVMVGINLATQGMLDAH